MKKGPGRKAETAGKAAAAREPMYLGLAAAVAAAWAILAGLNYLKLHPLNTDSILAVTIAPLLDATWRASLSLVPPAAAAALLLVLHLATLRVMGAPFVRWLGVRPADRGEDVFLSLLVGLGVFALLAQAGGIAGFYSRWLYVALLAVPVLTGWRRLAAEVRDASRLRPPALPFWGWLGIGAAVVTQGATFLSAFTPLHISDEQIYHVGYVGWYMWTHKVVLWPTSPFDAYPQLDAMNYGVTAVFNLFFGIKWIHWVVGLLSAWGVHRALAGLRRETRLALTLAYLTLPTLWIMAGRAFNEMYLCAYAAGALAAVRLRGTVPRSVLAGVFVGLAASCKYTGAFVGLTLLPFLPLRLLALSAGTALITFLPWLVKNWLFLQNPVWPYLYGLLGGTGWDQHLAWRLQKSLMQGEVTLRSKLESIPTFIWSVTMRNAGAWNDGNTGPLLPAMLGLLFVRATLLEWMAVIGFVAPIAFGSIGGRFLLPLLGLAFTVVGRGIDPIMGRKTLRRLLLTFGIAGLWFQSLEMFPTAWMHYDNPLSLLSTGSAYRTYLDRYAYPDMYYPYTYSRMLEAVEKLTPPNARVLFLGGYGGAFYVPRRTIYTALEGRPLPIYFCADARSPADVLKRFRQYGITHVVENRLSNHIFFDYWKMWDWGPVLGLVRWRDFWQRHAVPVWKFWNHFNLYRISPRPVPHPYAFTPGFEEESSKLILTMLRKRDFANVEKYLQDTLSLFPYNPALWLRMADFLASTGKLSKAKLCCTRVEQLAPGSTLQDLCQAELLLAQKRYREALVLLERAAAREPYDAEILRDLLSVYLTLGMSDRYEMGRRWFMLIKEYRPFTFR